MANLLSRKSIPTAKRLMVFGGPTTGKTTLVGAIAKKYKVLWLDLDQGIDTLYQSLTDTELERIEYIRVADTMANPIACDTLTKMFVTGGKGYICEDHSAWNCPKCRAKASEFFVIDMAELTLANDWVIVVDSGTHFSESCIHRVLDNSSIDITLAGKNDKATFAVYMAQGAMLHKLLTSIQNGVNSVVMTAHELEVEMPDKSKKLVPSMGTTKFARTINSYFSSVIRTSQVNGGFKVESLAGCSRAADVGGSPNLDLNDTKVTICDFLNPSNIGASDSGVATTKLGGGTKLDLSKFAKK